METKGTFSTGQLGRVINECRAGKGFAQSTENLSIQQLHKCALAGKVFLLLGKFTYIFKYAKGRENVFN